MSRMRFKQQYITRINKIVFICAGEKLTKEEAKGLMKELCEPEDDEGFMPFMRKYLFAFVIHH